MFETLKNAWKVADIRKKLLFTLMIIVLYRLGSAIPVPFVDGAELSKYFENASVAGSLLGYFNLLSGDAFSKATLFALNISPYITASIVIQLLTVAIPALEKMAKSGPEGQQKLNKITRIVTIALSLVMAYGYYVAIKDYLTSTGFFPCLVIVACFTAGASLTMWLGERIDENGIGNGISMVLFAGIVARGPQLAGVAWEYIVSAFNGEPLNLLWVILALAFMVAVVIFVIHITDAERRLPVQYAKRVVGRKMYGGQSTHLPMKVNMSGVMPIIFAQSIASLPATIGAFAGWTVKSEGFGGGMMRLFEEEFLAELAKPHRLFGSKQMDVVTGTMASPLITRMMDELHRQYPMIEVNVHTIQNKFFGGNVGVAGLVTATDIIAQCEGKLKSGTLGVPAVMLREEKDTFLDDMTIAQLGERLGVKVEVLPVSGGDEARALLRTGLHISRRRH